LYLIIERHLIHHFSLLIPNFTPFPVSPKGEMIGITPSPMGEGWEGGNNSSEINK
jgi:hypothetical protein